MEASVLVLLKWLSLSGYGSAWELQRVYLVSSIGWSGGFYSSPLVSSHFSMVRTGSLSLLTMLSGALNK
jgi:hypothetical protein